MRKGALIAARSVLYTLYTGIALTTGGIIGIMLFGSDGTSVDAIAGHIIDFSTVAEFGLLLLILSPLVGVFTLVGVFAIEKDYNHAGLALAVIILLAMALVIGSI